MTALPVRPTSRKRAAVFIKAAMEALRDAGGSLPLRDLRAEVEKRVELTSHDRAVYEKTGYVRWHSILHFYSIDCVKAGFLSKSGGRWFLTPEGEAVLSKPAEEILALAQRAYRDWRAAQAPEAPETDASATAVEDDASATRSLVFDDAEGRAYQEIRDHVLRMGPYEFQALVAALLRGMGYSTPFEAPRGPDGGTDILAYRDPLGVDTPHIRVQVKHRQDKARREEIAALRGIIRQDREIGLFVSSGGFTSEAVREAANGTVHIELIDLQRFLDLWKAHYDDLPEEDRGLLRLRKVFFLAPE